MMLRVQRERMNAAFFPSVREYSRRYGLDADRMARLPEHAIVMHPGPMNRGLEITAEVADSTALGDRRTGDERSECADGGALPACWAAATRRWAVTSDADQRMTSSPRRYLSSRAPSCRRLTPTCSWPTA